MMMKTVYKPHQVLLDKSHQSMKYLPQKILISLFFIWTMCGISMSVSAQDRSLYLRYQGMIDQVSGDLPNVIECLFTIKDSNDTQLWRERHESVYLIERNFTVALGATEPLTQDLFVNQVSLQVRCDIDADGSDDIEVSELIGETPRSFVALSTLGPVNANYVEINGVQVIDTSGQWVGPPLSNLPNPVESDQVANKAYVDTRFAELSLQVTTLQEASMSQVNQLSVIRQETAAAIITSQEVTTDQIEDLQADVDAQIEQEIEASDDRNLSARRVIDPSYPQAFTYRSRLFETYNESQGTPLFGDQSSLFGGVTPSAWSSGATADQVDLNRLGGFLTHEGHGDTNALMSMSHFTQTSTQQGVFFIAHFQVENMTDAIVFWPLQFEYSCFESRSEGAQRSSLALNGASVWSTFGQTCTQLSHSAQVTLELPPHTISDVVAVIAGSAPISRMTESGWNILHRRVMFAFTGECLTLPEGLRYRKMWH